ncbi:2'-5' RNA ligase [Bacillus methanolicus PB1]|uniref:RNA 2',3'-cyclic phosphodiesterase n=1 Tax=Bacillus methanolicus PB1 TaxID=997296 RepID=I3DYJ0_BACMT|nr:RNA 2',3'-cyclic phosphodiesterase [Bacillus methanolicus]EIJ79311.1 2'-5' RNA ligase [Bacillus methanolicus PB1]
MEKNPHYFLAVRLSKESKKLLHEKAEQLKSELKFARWVHHEDYHLTLVFLGNASVSQLNKTKELVQKYIDGTRAFSLIIQHFGTFGRKDSPRILWAGVNKEERLHKLRNLVFTACEKAGFQLDTRPFSPHITLARKWTGSSPFSPAFLSINNSIEEKPITFVAKDVVLYRTHFEKTPKYEPVATFPLLIE